ncbi:hypothetical protein UFOVP1288_30 [uncultured Caudovirales phage]|uniref:Uncharacterized protein n=1 Tax=uncultured Caudovirales phage TaxID=2100421 RepID=A0A6J5S7V3_9CAUD|nr:hypothetical protein UFOVP1195_30 [uncultured Caudovirales phage]CAB4195651.1 hypothetical protein UFOVP1288_30 [uncultured Caudovirales phage]CAB4204946.1 hypothetical protein UFOVP1409_30 [uncultured Caudovirales phage]
MSNVTIFKNQTAPTYAGKRELSPLAKALAAPDSTRRIQTNTNGTFKRIVNGEQIGNAVRGEINVIIVAALEKVSRVFYEAEYDPNAKATLPDCWSNLGDKPEAAASNQQSTNCAACPQNVKGSGKQGSRACRYQRRIAVLLEGDTSGDVYQFNIPAKSLFGKGTANVHPFESYKNYLPANGFSIDRVVTTIAYDLNADSMELLFSPVREISDEELELVTLAQEDPSTERLTKLVVAQADKVTKLPSAAAAPAARVSRTAEPEEEEDEEPIAAPVKRTYTKKAEATAIKPALASAMDAWADDE